MKILVTGATGLVGRPLVQRLLDDGHSVSVLSRNPEKASSLWSRPVKGYRWNSESEPAPAESLADVDGIIHLAGEGVADARWTPARKKSIYDSRILGTRHLFEGMKDRKAPPAVIISASAIGIYGDRGRDWLRESSAPGNGFLSDVCRDWEAELFKHENQGSRLVALRIGVVLSTEGGALKKLMPLFKMGMGGAVGSGEQWMSWIHRDDLVSLIVHSLTHSEVAGPINAVAPLPVTNSDFAILLGKVLRRPSFMKAPPFALRMAMGEMSDMVLTSQRVSSEHAQRTGFNFKFPFVELALSDLAKKKDEQRKTSSPRTMVTRPA